MQAFLDFWKPITLRHTLVLGVALILALALKDVLPLELMILIEELLFGFGCVMELYYYSKTKRMMLGGPPSIYVPGLAWTATEVCWPPYLRELLPPARVFDAVFIAINVLLLALVLVALGKDDAKGAKY